MDDYHICIGSEINRKMIAEAIQLDRLSYDDIYQLQVETCYDYFDKNNDIYIMAVDNENGNVIGYINFSPINESLFIELISGSTIDTVITGDDVLPYINGNHYFGYFSSIVVHPNYRQHGVATQMLLYWYDLVFRLARERNIYFKGIVADVVSEVDAHLLSEIGFMFAKASTHESKIMTLNLFKKNVVSLKFYDKLLTVYEQYNKKEVTDHVV